MRYTKIKREDAPQNVIRLPRLGKLRLGVKAISGSGKEYPKEVDYFKCPPEVQAVFGEKPTLLRVMIPTENEEMFCRQYYAIYGSNQRLKCQGDGETAERRDKDGAIEKIECLTPKDCEFAKKNKCRARMDLMVVIPDVAVGGVYQLSTGSINSDIDIRSGLAMARSLYGRISWVPMELKREPMKIADPESGKMNTHWPVKLYPVGNIETVMSVRKDPLLIPGPETSKYDIAEPTQEGPEPDTPIEVTEVGEVKEEAPDLNSKEDIIATLSSAPDLDTLQDLWRSFLPHINKLPNPDKVKIGMARDKRATFLKGKLV